MTEIVKTQGASQTRFALLWMNLAAEPLVALYTLIPFLLRKEFGCSLFQLSLFFTLRPILSIFSFYWSAYLKEGKSRLVSNCVSACALAYFPFLFFPWVDQFWFLLFASAAYQLFSRAAIPSLIEVLKRKLPKAPRERTFSLLFVLNFVESGVLGIFFGGVLETHAIDWKVLFCLGALMGLSSLAFFSFLKVPSIPSEEKEDQPLVKRSLIQPWKESFQLMRQRSDFRYFQMVFMVGGSALMLMLPAMISYYADTLQLSYTNMATARFVFMAMGVAGSSFLWTKGLSRIPLLKLTIGVLFGFGLFPLALLMAQIDRGFLYLGFLIYGVAQAGSHLIWNLSGTLFAAAGENSSPYTRVNLLMNALRGAVMPLIGGFLCDFIGPVSVLCLGAFLCLFGAQWLLRHSSRYILPV